MKKNIEEMSRAELVAARADTDDSAVLGRINARLADLAAEEHTTQRRGEILGAIQGGAVTPELVEADEGHTVAFENYLRRGWDGLSTEDRNVMDENRGGPLEDAERRALTTTVGTSGGFTVPIEMLSSIIEAQAKFGGIRRAPVNIISTSHGRDIEWPTSDDTGNSGELIDENVAASEQDVVFGQKVLKAWLWSSKLVKVPLTLVEDSAFDVVSFLGQTLGKRLGRAQAGYLITGTGSSQPEGIVTNATVGHTTTSGQTDSIIYDDLVEMEAALDGAYLENASWIISRDVLKQLRLVKDQQDNPILQPVSDKAPANILGYPYVVDDNLAAVAAGNKPLLFGDFNSGYTIRDVVDVELVVLRERYAEARQLGVLAWGRMDARPTHAGDDPYVTMAMAAS